MSDLTPNPNTSDILILTRLCNSDARIAALYSYTLILLDSIDGTNSFDGLDGFDGFDGFDSLDGFDGIDGFNGYDNFDSFDSFNGFNGLIFSASYITEYRVIVRLQRL